MEDPNKEHEIPPIYLKDLRHITNMFKDRPDDMPLSFEFMMTAFFPTVINNIHAEMKRQYTLGYKQGLEDHEN